MSIGVDLDRLRDEVTTYGSHPYLLSVADDGRPHATAVTMRWEDGDLVAGVGKRSAANVAERGDISVLWPPVEPGGYSLIVDGTASLDGDRVTVRPTRAVLHRQAGDGTASDCVRIEA